MNQENEPRTPYDEFMESVWEVKKRISREIANPNRQQRDEYFRRAREEFEQMFGRKLPVAGAKKRKIRRP